MIQRIVGNKTAQPTDEILHRVAHVRRRVAQGARGLHNAIRERGARLVGATKRVEERDEAVVLLEMAKTRRRRIRRPTLGEARDGWTQTPPLLDAAPLEERREKRNPMLGDRSRRNTIRRAGSSIFVGVILRVGVDFVVGARRRR